MSEVISINKSRFARPLKIIARIFSFLFHPLFIPVYLTAYLVFIQRLSFLPLPEKGRYLILAHVIVFSSFFPAFSVFLLWRLKFIENIYLRTQKERIIPYFIVMIFYFWTFYLFRNQPAWPQVMSQLYCGIFICICVAVILNNFFKISMHAMGVGGALAFVGILLINGLILSIYPLVIAIGLAGIVCSARLVLQDHRPFDVYTGLFVGVISQVIATRFVDLHL